MTEAECRQKTVDCLHRLVPALLLLRHEERRGGRSGVPDLSMTGWQKTTWWEFKYADPDVEGTNIQELTMLRAATLGSGAWYVIFEEDRGNRSVRIVSPSLLKVWRDETPLYVGPSRVDYDYLAVASTMLRLHKTGE